MRTERFRRVATLIAIGAAGSSAACRAEHGAGIRLASATTLSAATDVGTAPMFAVSLDGAQASAWVSAPGGGTDGRLYVAMRGAEPEEIRDSLGSVEAHGEAPPKLAYGPDGTLYAAYTVGKVVPGVRFPLSALRIVRSADGRSWSAPETVTDGPVFGAHSFHALHVAPDGTVYVSWLGASAAWLTRSTDEGRTWTPRVRVDLGEACPCCRTALATGRDGTLYMAWREVYPGNVRDIVVARSADHGSTWSAPVRVHEDDWRFDACPHAGPALAMDSAGVLHVTWWTGKEGQAGVYYARSTDGARSFEAPLALGVARFSRPAHVQIAVARGNRVLVSWDDGTRRVPQVVLRVSTDGGHSFGARTPVSAAGRAATFPVLGVAGDSLAIAWSEESAQDAAAEAEADAKMRSARAPMGLHAVGTAQVLVRRGRIQ